MDRQVNPSRQRRKLSKSQVIEILERNVGLYKHEDSFVHYLVELGVYLLEYEYDWAESGEAAPANLRPRPEDVAPASKSVQQSGKMISSAINPAASHAVGKRNCPFCGTETGDAYVCPKCRNMTR